MLMVNILCAFLALVVVTLALDLSFYAVKGLLDVSYRVVTAALDRRRSGPPPP